MGSVGDCETSHFIDDLSFWSCRVFLRLVTLRDKLVSGVRSAPFLRHHERPQDDGTSRTSDTAFAHADVVMYRSYEVRDARDLTFFAIDEWRYSQGHVDEYWQRPNHHINSVPTIT